MAFFKERRVVRPIRVEAVKFIGLSNEKAFSEFPWWLLNAIDDGEIFLDDSDETLKMRTLGSPLVIPEGVFLGKIRGSRAPLMVCEPNIFLKTYELDRDPYDDNWEDADIALTANEQNLI